jgi:hypothetical protein
MTAHGVTTMHIFEAEYLNAHGRSMYSLKPSRNGWQSSVIHWRGATAAFEHTDAFFKMVVKRAEALYPRFDEFSVEVGPRRALANGAGYVEKMLMGRYNGSWQVFAKVEIAYGQESVMNTWEANERLEWFNS